MHGLLFIDLDDQCELHTGSVLTENVTLVSACPISSSCRARGQSNSVHDLLARKSKQNAMRPTGSTLAHAAHGHRFCLVSMCRHWKMGFRAAKEVVGVIEGDLTGRKVRKSELFEMKDKSRFCNKSRGIYDCDFR